MAATYKITYKNHCTPQERIDFGDSTYRWYLDSDVGSRLTGAYVHTTATQPVYVASATISAETALASSKAFLYVKNLGGGGGNDLLLSFDNGGTWPCLLSSGESFSSLIETDLVVKIIPVTGDSTIEHLTAV